MGQLGDLKPEVEEVGKQQNNLKDQLGATLWLINSSPWNITILIGKPRQTIYKWAINTMAMLTNQTVIPIHFLNLSRDVESVVMTLLA